MRSSLFVFLLLFLGLASLIHASETAEEEAKTLVKNGQDIDIDYPALGNKNKVKIPAGQPVALLKGKRVALWASSSTGAEVEIDTKSPELRRELQKLAQLGFGHTFELMQGSPKAPVAKFQFLTKSPGRKGSGSTDETSIGTISDAPTHLSKRAETSKGRYDRRQLVILE